MQKLRWTNDLQFYILCNSSSVISGHWEGDNERLCALEPHLPLKRFLSMEIDLRNVRSADQLLTH